MASASPARRPDSTSPSTHFMTLIAIQPVVMAGGSGTRLWPLSRAQHPKQFLALNGKRTLFQQALQRLASLASDDIVAQPASVVGNEEHRFVVLDQMREIGQ